MQRETNKQTSKQNKTKQNKNKSCSNILFVYGLDCLQSAPFS